MARWGDLPSEGVIGRQAGMALLRQVLGTMADGDAPAVGRAWLVDHQFDAWPLDDDAVLDGLSRWLRPNGRRLGLIGVDFEAVARRFPRLNRWRRPWSHRIDIWRPGDGHLPTELCGLLADDLALQWLDARPARLRVVMEQRQLRALHEQCADFLQRCEPAWPDTTLGL